MSANFGNNDISTSGSITADSITANSITPDSITAATGNFTTSLKVSGIPVPTGVGTTSSFGSYVAKWTTSNSIGNSAIFDYGSGVAIGYAYTSPRKLYVGGSLGVDRDCYINGKIYLEAANSSSPNVGIESWLGDGIRMFMPSGGYFDITQGDGYGAQRLTIDGNGNVKFNSPRDDCDFSVAGTGDANLLFADASTDRVGIGTASPSSKLDVSGIITATGGNSTQWNTAYGWGDHGTQGYLIPSFTPPINLNQVLAYNGSNWINKTFNISLIEKGSIPFGGYSSSQMGYYYSWNSNSEAVVNDGGNNINFRVESVSDTHLLYVDGSTNSRVGIGTASPSSKLTVAASNEEGICIHTTSASAQNFKIGRNASNGTLVFKGSQNNFSAYEFRSTIGGVSKTVLQTDRLTGAITFNDQFTFPTTDGSADQVLVTNGNGVLSWQDQTGSGTPTSSSSYAMIHVFG